MSRLDAAFARLRRSGETGLVAYVTAGDPDLERSASVVRAVDRGGADVIEVGVPFSDPVADGPIIERAAGRARAAGASLSTAIALVADTRSRLRAPVVLFTYVNPVLAMGEARFAAEAAAAGVDGVLVLDLPLEEAGSFRGSLAAAGLDMIFLISPTTSDERIVRAASLGSGFLYAISRLGVTGTRATMAEGASGLVRRIRARTTLPVAVGFGLSTAEHVKQAGEWADAAVVGSALVEVVAQAGTAPDLEARVEGFVRGLKGPGRAAGQVVPA